MKEEKVYLVKCPQCGEYSDSIKRYDIVTTLWFLWVWVRYGTTTYTCCPHCMRKHILTEGIFTWRILSGNIFWLFIMLPMSLVQLLFSFTKGHSRTVKKDLGI